MTVGDLIMAAINRHWELYYMSPSIRDLQQALGYVSTNTVWYHVQRLVESGQLLDIPYASARTIVPVWVRDVIEEHEARRSKLKR